MKMMKNWCSRPVWLASAVVLCLSVASAQAVWVDVFPFLPGVDANGVLDNSLGAYVQTKITLNTTNGNFHLHGHGFVRNLSPGRMEYKDIPFSIPGVNIKSFLYQVDKVDKKDEDSRITRCDLHARGDLSFGAN